MAQTLISDAAVAGEVLPIAAGVETLTRVMTAFDPVVARVLVPDIEARLIEIAELLARCQDVRFLQRHRSAWASLLVTSPDVVAARLRQAIRSCSGGCRVRQFWEPLMAETLQDPAVVWSSPR